VLKLDVEGGEYDVLGDLLRHPPTVLQLLVEFHHGAAGIPFAATVAAVAALRGAGYRLFHRSRRGLELSFARRP
jgi:Methyltransferase FkbM domain